MDKSSILFWGELPPKTLTGISVSNNLTLKILRDSGFNIERIEEYTWNKNSVGKILGLISNFWNILRILNKKKIDIFYFNFSLSTFGIIKLLAIIPFIKLLSKKTKKISHLHRGDFSVYMKKSINKFLASLCLRFIDELVVLSPVFKEEIQNFFDEIEIAVLHNTSSLEDKYEKGNKQYIKNFVCISNYIRTKGIKNLIDVFGKEELKNFSLDIYGSTYEKQFYNQLIENKSQNVKFNDKIERKEIANILKTHDCLILPSWNEGQPIIILEAMSLGIPIIATKIGDVPNMLGEEYKFLAEPKDSGSLQEAIIMFDNCPLKSEISDYLYKRYQLNYSNKLHKDQVIRIFKNKETN